VYSAEFQCPQRIITGPTHYTDPVYKVDVQVSPVQQPTGVNRIARQSYASDMSSEMSEGSYMRHEGAYLHGLEDYL
jgi:hypothetical protein